MAPLAASALSEYSRTPRRRSSLAPRAVLSISVRSGAFPP
jgi:hypothetical protein